MESTVGDGQLVLFSRTRNGLTVGSQRVLEPNTTRNRVHLDHVADLDAVTAEVDALGGWWLDPAIMHDLAGFQWRFMPEHHTR